MERIPRTTLNGDEPDHEQKQPVQPNGSANGATVNVDGGSYITNGYNSPSVYSTAAISIKNAELTANNSEALVIEGKNSIALENCNVTGNMSDTEGTSSDENVHNMMIYQSMSGDADVGTSEFTMNGGTLTCNNGDYRKQQFHRYD